MTATYSAFYRFLGVHSLLIGLFPFFIPVYLWKTGFTLSYICLFIAISGLTFCLGLRAWERIEALVSLPVLMSLTLLLELLLLVVNLAFSQSLSFLLMLAVANGLYNCFFWTTQRTLFLHLTSTNDSGRQYGNFQIFVMVFLKGGILLGGLLLEHLGFNWVISVSTLIVIIAIAYLLSSTSQTHRHTTTAAQTRTTHPSPRTVGIHKVLTFNDEYGSKSIFIIDGLFLFLESHFWTISLFLITDENFARLGIIIIVLAILFALMFYVAKNSIDRLMGKRIYQVAVLMYCTSWLLRMSVSGELETQWLFILLLVITFFSSFFRLAFNKRFFDIAKESVVRDYLIIKSYYTQSAVVVIFSALAAVTAMIGNDANSLNLIYLVSGGAALGYLNYRHQSTANGSRESD